MQDLGRYGHQASGVPVAGPMDTFSHRLANQLVGNAADAATLEITLIGPELIVEADTTMAIAGAEFEVTCDDRPVADRRVVRRDARAAPQVRPRSCRALERIWPSPAAFRREPVLGSRATHLVSRMGGFNGRALAAGDRLPIANEPPPRPHAKVGRA